MFHESMSHRQLPAQQASFSKDHHNHIFNSTNSSSMSISTFMQQLCLLDMDLKLIAAVA
jgi:hypothetical protein